MKKKFSLLCLAVLFLMLGGCRMIRIEEGNKTPLTYKIAYQKGNDLFLTKGYGRQMSGGYSIQVEGLSTSSNAIFFETKLIGPTEKIQGGEPSYPYIVIKTEYRDGPVQFQ